MGVSIYAGKTEHHPTYGTMMGPVIDFVCWEPTVWPEDADARFQRGEDVEPVANPHYVANAGMDLSNGNADTLLDALRLDREDGQPTNFAIDTVQQAVMRLINGDTSAHERAPDQWQGTRGAQFFDPGLSGDKIALYCARILGLIIEGRKRGATHIVVA